MNKTLSILIALVVTLFTVQCTTRESGEAKTQPEVQQQPPPEANNMPQLTVRLTNGQQVALRDVTGNTMLIFFNPGCDHCEREAEQIKLRKQLFAQHQVYFISTVDAAELNAFAAKYELTDENFIFAQADAAAVFESVGNLPSVPAIFIYKNKQFVKRFDGETSLDVVKEFL